MGNGIAQRRRSVIYDCLVAVCFNLSNCSPYAVATMSCLSVLPVHNVGVSCPNGWMDQDATRYGGGPRPRWQFLDGDPAPLRRKGHRRSFGSFSVVLCTRLSYLTINFSIHYARPCRNIGPSQWRGKNMIECRASLFSDVLLSLHSLVPKSDIWCTTVSFQLDFLQFCIHWICVIVNYTLSV